MKPSEDSGHKNIPSADPLPPTNITQKHEEAAGGSDGGAASGGLVTINRRMIIWTPEGVPMPSSSPLLSKQNIEDLATTALSLPYTGGEEEFASMTNAEVMLVRLARAAAGGDQSAAEALMDRVLGRPKQSVESKSFRMTYEDLLKEKAAAAQRAETVEVQIVRDDKPFGDLEGLV